MFDVFLINLVWYWIQRQPCFAEIYYIWSAEILDDLLIAPDPGCAPKTAPVYGDLMFDFRFPPSF